MPAPRRIAASTAAATLLVLASAAAQQHLPPEKRVGARSPVPGALRFEDPPHATFADVHQHRVVHHQLRVHNDGLQPVRILEAVSISPGGTVEAEPPVIVPGQAAVVRVRQDVGTALGRTAYRYALVSDEPGVSRYRFSLSGFVESAYDPENVLLDLGRVDRSTGASARVELASREVERLELHSVTGLPSFMTLEPERFGVVDEGLRLTARLAPGAPLGALFGELELHTNVASQPVVRVPYRALVLGDVVPSEHPVAFGLVPVGQASSRQVRISSRSGRPFVVERVTDLAGLAATSVAPCSEDLPNPCWTLAVRVEPAEPQRFSGVLEVALAGDEEPIPVVYSGVAVAPGTTVVNVGPVGDPPPATEEEE